MTKKDLPSLEEIWLKYSEVNSLHRTAEFFGLKRDKVRKLLIDGGFKLDSDKWSPKEDLELMNYYDDSFTSLDHISSSLKRTKRSVSLRAEKLGVLEPKHARTKTNQLKSEQHRQSLILSTNIPEAESPPPPKIKHKKTAPRNPSAHYYQKYKGGWAEISGKRRFFRSKWEINYAHYLESLKSKGEILDWEFEPETFFFEGVRQGHTSYLPDFKVTYPDGTHAWHEVKGWMDPGSKTKLARMAKYFPEEKIYVVDSEVYKTIERNLSHTIPGWVVS